MKKVLLILTIILIVFAANAQKYAQNITGTLIDKTTKALIENVKVVLYFNNVEIRETLSNADGYFVFEQVEVGRYDLLFEHISYQSFIKPAVLVSASRATNLEINLANETILMNELVIKPQKDRNTPNNEMAMLSSISIDVEDTRRLAGGLDDPIRAAANFAGVNSNGSFSDNFISIRGNSARALKYNMEGVELANPTHFARIGSAGGTFTIFSIAVLDKSDFFIGAFPAEYSNALGGVLDVKFRKGNTKNHELAIQIGTLGLDFSAEGPLKKGSKNSYLVNYRYATVGLARFIGYPTQPTYQDVAFNLNFPLQNNANVKIFGMAGLSDRLREAELDSTLWEENLDRYRLALNSKLATVGITYQKLLRNQKSLFKTTALASYTKQQDNKDYLLLDSTFINRNTNEYSSIPLAFASSLNSRFTARHTNKTGFNLNFTNHNYFVSKLNFESSINDTLVKVEGTNLVANFYSQSKVKINSKINMIAGFNVLHQQINNATSFEPRLTFDYKLNAKNSLTFAYGNHSQTEEFAVYKFQSFDNNGNTILPNEDLQLIKANHFVVAYKTILTKNHRLRLEAYLQNINDVPLERNGTFSTINLEELSDIRNVANIGTAKNYGIDLSFERFTDKGFYYMINGSWIRSFYFDENDNKRSTSFDYGYNAHFLIGREYLIGEKKDKRNFFGWNFTYTATGGRPYIPIDLEKSRNAQETVLNESLAFTARDNPLTLLDVTFSLRNNKETRTSLWLLQIKNIFSTADALIREYDVVTDQVETIPSSGFFPSLSWQLQF